MSVPSYPEWLSVYSARLEGDPRVIFDAAVRSAGDGEGVRIEQKSEWSVLAEAGDNLHIISLYLPKLDTPQEIGYILEIHQISGPRPNMLFYKVCEAACLAVGDKETLANVRNRRTAAQRFARAMFKSDE